MSTPLAIAAVSYVLKNMLTSGLLNRPVPVSNFSVTVLPPDRIATGDEEEALLNLFMYMVTPNQGWRNNHLPSHDYQGQRIDNPPLALDLHYLLSAYGGPEHHPEILLGYGMQILHENPVLAPETITDILGGTLPQGLESLALSGLADQVERIKITPEMLNTEEISRMWTAFGSKYRPTAAYKATVVLMQTPKTKKSSLPVRRRNLYVLPFHQPVIDAIASMPTANDLPQENQKILSGHWLALQGTQLRGEIVQVNIGSQSLIPQSADIEQDQIKVKLPGNLKAGMQVVQVVHQINMGTPPQPHEGVSSNAVAFMMSPNFTPPPNPFNLSGGNANITLNGITPPLEHGQKVELLLNQINTPPNVAPKAFHVQAPKANLPNPNTTATSVTIPVPSAVAGDYLVRLRVDNAESPLSFNQVSGQYNAPTLTIN